MEREKCEILSAYTEHPDMECMWSQREPCGHACSHVGIKSALALLSFAVCLLFVWNICLQLQLYANMDMSTRCSDLHEPLKGEMKNSKTKNSEVYILSCFQFFNWINDKFINCYRRRILNSRKASCLFNFPICFFHFRILVFKVHPDYEEAVVVSIIKEYRLICQ